MSNIEPAGDRLRDAIARAIRETRDGREFLETDELAIRDVLVALRDVLASEPDTIEELGWEAVGMKWDCSMPDSHAFRSDLNCPHRPVFAPPVPLREGEPT